MKNSFAQKGSLLLEMLLAVLVGVVIIGAVAGLMFVSSKSGQNSGAKSAAVALAEEGLEAMQSIGENDWHNIYLPPDGAGDPDADKGELEPYYIYKNGSLWTLGKIITGDEGNIEIDGIIYARKIYIDNVSRSNTGDREIVVVGGARDPSTQKIKIVVSKNGSVDIILEEYLTRWKNKTSSQNNWSGGGGQEDFSDDTKYSSDDGNINIRADGGIELKP